LLPRASGRKGRRYLNAGTFIVVANNIEVRPSAAARAIVMGDIEVLGLLLLTELLLDLLYCPGVADDLTDIRARWSTKCVRGGVAKLRQGKRWVRERGILDEPYRLRTTV
jgi:hypothetical protein